MPPATSPVPVLVLENLQAALALIAGGPSYYHTASVVGIGRDITQEALSYPAVFLGEPSEVGQFTQREGAMWHGDWAWDIPIFGVIRNVGMGDDAYKELLKLAADIYRAVLTDYTRGGLASLTEVAGWTILGPQESTDGRPWVGVQTRVIFRTKDTEMVTVPA